MKIISWNINGIRAVVKKGFKVFLEHYQPDILGLQEIKISSGALAGQEFDFAGYQEFWNSAQRPGYSGTALLVRANIRTEALAAYPWDDEGRVQVLDLGPYYIVNVYFPNANHELSRLDFKIAFNDRLLRHLKKLEKEKPLVVMGDFNVAHQEIDLARPKENIGNPGFHPRERAWMDKFLSQGFADTFRRLNPDAVKYSWWSFRARARERNVGWRIDYVAVSEKMMPRVKDAFIQNKVIGSDHCPVGIEIK